MQNASRFTPMYCLAIAGLTITLVFMPEHWAGWMAYDREAILAGEWWRLWSGHFTHFTLMHASVNSALLLLLSLTLCRVFSRKFILALFFIGPAAISLLLALFVQEMILYRGASALASLLMALLICHAFYQMQGKSVSILYAIVLGWSIKLIFESLGISLTDLPHPIHVAWQAHLAGIMIGVAIYFGQKQYVFKGADEESEIAGTKFSRRISQQAQDGAYNPS